MNRAQSGTPRRSSFRQRNRIHLYDVRSDLTNYHDGDAMPLVDGPEEFRGLRISCLIELEALPIAIHHWLAETIKRLEEVFADERQKLEAETGKTDNVSTEKLPGRASPIPLLFRSAPIGLRSLGTFDC